VTSASAAYDCPRNDGLLFQQRVCSEVSPLSCKTRICPDDIHLKRLSTKDKSIV